jgi:MoaA/NifB/PqqE/SkfB family radical SAM enzyme
MRCRHAFETVCVHANGDLVCSIIDGRGDFVLGNVYENHLRDIFFGPRYAQLRELVLSTSDGYCRAIGKTCPLKQVPVASGEAVAATPRFLQIEPTTACDLRCLSCPVRDFDASLGMADSFRDGGVAFGVWDGVRRLKQHAADAVRPLLGRAGRRRPHQRTRLGAALFRGRPPRVRNGTLPLAIVKRILDEVGPDIERLDFFNYGEPFLYRHLVDALRHARRRLPAATLAISTDGMQVKPPIEDAILSERLLDDLVFSIDGNETESYARYRIRGQFDRVMANLMRVHDKARGTGVRVIWQYVVFRWNDSNTQLSDAIRLADSIGVPIWFDFARSTWGRSERRRQDLEFVRPYLRPDTDLPTWT